MEMVPLLQPRVSTRSRLHTFIMTLTDQPSWGGNNISTGNPSNSGPGLETCFCTFISLSAGIPSRCRDDRSALMAAAAARLQNKKAVETSPRQCRFQKYAKKKKKCSNEDVVEPDLVMVQAKKKEEEILNALICRRKENPS